MLGELYGPQGLAFETAKAVLQDDYVRAVNVALGCTNGCLYCYGPLASRQGPKYASLRLPKKTPIELIDKQMSRGYYVDSVFISFLTDPYLPCLREETEKLVNYLLAEGKETATLSKVAVSDNYYNMNGLTIVSPYKAFSAKYEPNVPSSQDRIDLLRGLENSWVSMEPWPISEIYPYRMKDILAFWEEISNAEVEFIIFGKWNYDKRARTEKARQEYAEIVPQFIDFCKSHGIRYHIKSDTLKFISTQSKGERIK